MGTNVSQLFVNGQMMSEARSANSGYVNPVRRAFNTVDTASTQTSPTPSTITSASLGTPSNGSWTGAKMSIITGLEWVAYTRDITAQTGNTITYPSTSTFSSTSYTPRAGNQFYLYGSLAAVDVPKEYYYDTSNSKLYFNSTVNPNAQTVEVRTRQLGFNVGNHSYVDVSGFRFLAANVNVSGSHNTIDNCQIYYPTPFEDSQNWTPSQGVVIGGHNNTISNSEIAYSWGDGVTVRGSSNTVHNNVVHDVAWNCSDAAAVDIVGSSNATITNNTMYNAARTGVTNGNATGATITNNEIARFGFLTTDLGGTYCYQTDGGGTTIAYNYIHDCLDKDFNGAGVYLDSGSSNFNIHHNVVANAMIGVHAGNPNTNDNIYNNTLWGITKEATRVVSFDLTNCNTYNNLSNQGSFYGNSTGTNIATTNDQFVNSAAGDFRLKSSSIAINAGTVIPGITDNQVGAPDVGAFEYGAEAWTAGASFKTWHFANQVVAPLTASVSVTSSNSRTTTGSLIAGRTSSSSSSNRRSFLKFDVSGISGDIQSAVLRVYENTKPSSASGGVSLYAVTSAWDPNTVTYTQSTAATGTEFYNPDYLDLYTDIDVTSIVQGWIDAPSSNFGFSLRSDAEGSGRSAKYFEGMYGVTAPQLIITVPEPGALSLLWSAALAGLGVLATAAISSKAERAIIGAARGR